jgi:alkanesulfonate monooxygenase SsuD/methylene tetrahydromethanopterin reductase-like flavin-dependent oxidoreductase (luciferase family)
VEFGFCYIPDYHPEVHGDYAAWYARLLDEWELADRLGFNAVWLAEHRYPGYGFSSLPVVAMALAARTSRIRVGTAVALLSQRHPVLTAEDWAAVDLLSGGRLNFGIGRGIYSYDFGIAGVPSAESRSRFEESWQVIRRLWTEDGVKHHGKHWSFPAHNLGPKPLQKPLPPVYVAGVVSPESYVWAAEQGCNLMVAPFLLDSLERQAEYVGLYRRTLGEHGHDPARFSVVANYHLAIVHDDSELAAADEYFHNYFRFLHRTSNPRELDAKAYDHYARGGGLYSDVDEMRRTRSIFGTVDQCVKKMAELREACGLTGWMFHINYGGVPHERVVEQMHTLRKEIMPRFQAVEAG